MIDALSKALGEINREDPRIENLRRLSGGASQETWSFDAVSSRETLPLILRRSPGGGESKEGPSRVSLEMEARLIEAARAHDVPAPRVLRVLSAEDGLGAGYVMDRVQGETIPRKILRDAEFDAVRPKLARQCGEVLARIHSVDLAPLTGLPTAGPRAQWQYYRDIYDRYNYPHPVFEIAFRWLDERMPPDLAPKLVHGDFRNGNLLIGPDVVRAVLDWELAHAGDPMEDLGWICVNSWRFGNVDNPVGGFGAREDLFRGYADAGGAPDPERVHYWETFGTLKWGVMCMTMYDVYQSGMDRSVERAAIGRRSSETEIDLLNLLAPRV